MPKAAAEAAKKAGAAPEEIADEVAEVVSDEAKKAGESPEQVATAAAQAVTEAGGSTREVAIAAGEAAEEAAKAQDETVEQATQAVTLALQAEGGYAVEIAEAVETVKEEVRGGNWKDSPLKVLPSCVIGRFIMSPGVSQVALVRFLLGPLRARALGPSSQALKGWPSRRS